MERKNRIPWQVIPISLSRKHICHHRRRRGLGRNSRCHAQSAKEEDHPESYSAKSRQLPGRAPGTPKRQVVHSASPKGAESPQSGLRPDGSAPGGVLPPLRECLARAGEYRPPDCRAQKTGGISCRRPCHGNPTVYVRWRKDGKTLLGLTVLVYGAR
jgi:hypothetical protein